METSRFQRISKSKSALLAAMTVVAIVGLGGTAAGQRLFAQIGISDTLAQTTDAAGRVVQKSSNAVQAFLGRSPGARGATDTLKGKASRNLAQETETRKGPKPTQRALGKIFDEPLQSLAGPLTPAVAPPVFLPIDGATSAASIPALAIPVGSGFFAPVIGGGVSGGGFAGGGGGGGGGGEGPIGEGPISPAPPITTPVPPIATAVPEPSTWMLLLIGFAAVGASLRRAKVAQKNSGVNRAGNCATAS